MVVLTVKSSFSSDQHPNSLACHWCWMLIGVFAWLGRGRSSGSRSLFANAYTCKNDLVGGFVTGLSPNSNLPSSIQFVLGVDEYMCTFDHEDPFVRFGLDFSGDLVLTTASPTYDEQTSTNLWSAGIVGGTIVELLPDGNLVVWQSRPTVIINNTTHGNTNSNDGILLWESNTRGIDAIAFGPNKDNVELRDEIFRLYWATDRDGAGGLYGGGPCINNGPNYYSPFEPAPIRLVRRNFFCHSTNPNYIFGLQEADGDLVLLDVSKDTFEVLWSANTLGAVEATLLEDGNFVVLDADGQIMWQTFTDGNGKGVSLMVEAGDDGTVYAHLVDQGFRSIWWTLRDGGGVHGGGPCFGNTPIGTGSTWIPDSYICSTGNVIFGVTPDGDLALLDVSKGNERTKIWSAGTAGHPDAFAYFDTFGNLVVYESQEENAAVLWESNTGNQGGTTLAIRDSGVVSDSYVEITLDVGFTTLAVLWRSDGGLPTDLGRPQESASTTSTSGMVRTCFGSVRVLVLLVSFKLLLCV